MKQGDMNAIKELAATALTHNRYGTGREPDVIDRQIVHDMLVGIQRIIQASIGSNDGTELGDRTAEKGAL